MGDVVENKFTPIQINYKYDHPEIAFDAKTKKCNESYPVKFGFEIHTNPNQFSNQFFLLSFRIQHIVRV